MLLDDQKGQGTLLGGRLLFGDTQVTRKNSLLDTAWDPPSAAMLRG